MSLYLSSPELLVSNGWPVSIGHLPSQKVVLAQNHPSKNSQTTKLARIYWTILDNCLAQHCLWASKDAVLGKISAVQVSVFSSVNPRFQHRASFFISVNARFQHCVSYFISINPRFQHYVSFLSALYQGSALSKNFQNFLVISTISRSVLFKAALWCSTVAAVLGAAVVANFENFFEAISVGNKVRLLLKKISWN